MKKMILGLLLFSSSCNPFAGSDITEQNEIILDPSGKLAVQISEYEFIDETGQVHTVYISFP